MHHHPYLDRERRSQTDARAGRRPLMTAEQWANFSPNRLSSDDIVERIAPYNPELAAGSGSRRRPPVTPPPEVIGGWLRGLAVIIGTVWAVGVFGYFLFRDVLH